MIVGDTSLIDSLITSSKLGNGSHVHRKKVEILQGKKDIISSNSKKPVYGHAMGEYLGPVPHTFICRHKVLKILKMS